MRPAALNRRMLVTAAPAPLITNTGNASNETSPGAAIPIQTAVIPRKINPAVFCDLLVTSEKK